MIEEVGRVTACSNGQIEIEVAIKSTCSNCQAADNCGTSTIAKAFSGQKENLTIQTHQQIEVGQQVKIGIPEEVVLSLSSFVYLVPLLVLLAGVVIGDNWLMPLLGLENEIWNIALGAGLMFLAFKTVRWYLNSHSRPDSEPVILAVMNANDIAVVQVN